MGEKSTGGQATSGTKAKRTYEAELSLAGVQFGPLLRDIAQWSKESAPDAPKAAEQLETPAKAEAGPGQGASGQGLPGQGSGDRGSLDAQVSLAGVVGDEASRLGRGEARVGGGQVVNYPLLMRLIRVSNLQLPINDRVEVARASFYMEGDTVTFEDVSVASGSVEILGFGTVKWPGLEADMRFNSQAVRRVPVMSDLLESVRDELITTKVTGKLSEPEVTTVGFSGTRELLSRIFGGGRTEQDRRMQEIEDRARRERQRAKSASGPAVRGGE